MAAPSTNTSRTAVSCVKAFGATLACACVAFFAFPAALFVSPTTAFAQTESAGGYAITRMDVSLYVGRDAALNVSERIEGAFLEPRRGIFRTIPVRYQTDRGRELIVPLDVVFVHMDGEPVPFETYREGRDQVIRIGDPDVYHQGSFTYDISYVARRVFLYEEETDQLYWNATGTAWDVPIPLATARVFLPDEAAFTETACFTGAQGSTARDCTVQVEGSVATFTAEDTLTVAVRFPKGVIAPPSAADRAASFWLRVVPRLFWLIPLAVAFAAFRYWRAHGRDAKGRGTIIAEYDPPDGLRPTEVGMLIDTKVHPRDLSAAFVDLAVRGYLRIEERAEKTLGVFSSKTYVLHKLKDGDGLHAFERGIFDALFKDGASKTMKNEDAGMAAALAKAGNDVYADMAARGYFTKNPKTAGWAFAGTGLAVLFIGFFVGALLAVPFDSVQPLGALLLSGVVLLAAAPFMKAYTEKGAVAKEHAEGFKLFLTTAEKYRLQWQEREGIFEAYLPYAMAFGVTDKWAKAFEGMNLPAPTWYVGATAGAFLPVNFAKSVSSFGTSAAAVHAPSSSGGGGFGGGGFSGGGFGGGGGGSW